MTSKHHALDQAIERVVSNSDYPLYTDNVQALLTGRHRDDRSLILRRLNNLASKGIIRKTGYRDFVKWDTTCPETLVRRAKRDKQEKQDRARARSLYIELGFAVDPESIELPRGSDHDAYYEAYEQKEKLQDALDRLCNYTVELTPAQFLWLAKGVRQ